MYKRSDITEQNIGEIAKEYGLEVTRHNAEKQTITFALLDSEGKRTKQRLKLVEQINKKKKKGEEVAVEDVKLAIKMERLEEQERGNFANEDMNIFTYSNFFRNREKEKEVEKGNKELLEILDIKDKELEKEKVLEKEKEKELHSTSKEEVAVADEKAKASTDDDLMSSLEKIAIALSKKPKIDNRPKIFDKLKDFKEITDELETLEFERDHRLTYSNVDIEKDFNNAVYLAFHSLISRKVEFNNEKEADRANEIMQNIEKNTTDENIRRNLDLVNQLIKDNQKEYERLKKNGFREVEVAEEEIETNKLTELESPKNDTPNKITNNEIVRNNEEIEVTEVEAETKTNKLTELESPKNDTPNNLTKVEVVRNEEEMELELSIKKLADHYGDIIEKYNLYNSLPAFQVYTDDELLIDTESNYNRAEDYVIDLKDLEFWDNMTIKDIREWEKLKNDDEEISIIYKDKNNEFTDYTEYAEETVVNYLKKHREKIKDLELEYRTASHQQQVNKDNKDIDEKKGEKDYEYGD